MDRVLIAGDTHGHLGWIKWIARQAVRNDCDTILQLGDFGFWEHQPHGRVFLDEVNETLATAGLTLYWVDGNHECHDLLEEYDIQINHGFREIRSRIFHIPRGQRWTWNGVKFLGCGGAYSIDARGRLIGVSWWPQELITDTDVEDCGDEKADVLVAHDAPWGVDIPCEGDPNTYMKSWDPTTQQNRFRLLEVVRNTEPDLILHGHYHTRYSSTLQSLGVTSSVEGFGRDGDMKGAWGVLELPSLELRSPPELRAG